MVVVRKNHDEFTLIAAPAGFTVASVTSTPTELGTNQESRTWLDFSNMRGRRCRMVLTGAWSNAFGGSVRLCSVSDNTVVASIASGNMPHSTVDTVRDSWLDFGSTSVVPTSDFEVYLEAIGDDVGKPDITIYKCLLQTDYYG